MLAGALLVGLGFVGLFLPLLPTTPLLLLAAACFARSSERWHRWLMQHRLFGPIISNWQTNRCIPRRSKYLAVATIVLFGTFTLGFALTHPYARVIGGILILIGLVCVLRIPVCEKNNGS